MTRRERFVLWLNKVGRGCNRITICVLYITTMLILATLIFGATQQKATSNITVNYSRPSYTVTFDPAGGEVSSSSKTVKLGDNYGDLPTPTRPGYSFAGWYTKQNFQYSSVISLKSLYDLGRFSEPTKYVLSNVTDVGCTISSTNPSSFAYTRAEITDLLEVGKEYTCSFVCNGNPSDAMVSFDGLNADGVRVLNNETFVAEQNIHYYVKIYTNWDASSKTGTVTKQYTDVKVYEINEELIDLRSLYDNGKFTYNQGLLSNVSKTSCTISTSSAPAFYYARADITDILELGETYFCTYSSSNYKYSSVHIDGYDNNSKQRVQSSEFITKLPNTTYYIKLYANCSPTPIASAVSIDYIVSLKKWKTNKYGNEIDSQQQNTTQGNQEFVAYWEPTLYYVNYYNGDTLLSTEYMYYYVSQLNCGVVPKKEGYSFTGFWTEKSGGIKIIDSDGRAIPVVSGYLTGNRNYYHVGDLNLYAQFA